MPLESILAATAIIGVAGYAGLAVLGKIADKANETKEKIVDLFRF